MYIQDNSLSTYVKIDDGHEYISIGWLGNRVPSRGNMPSIVVDDIRVLIDAQRVEEDCFLGKHTCEICLKVDGCGSFWVAKNDRQRWIMPALILHYIVDHGYKIEEDVQLAIRNSVVELPPPITTYSFDSIIRNCGLVPIGFEGEMVVVKGGDHQLDVVEDLRFAINRRIKLINT
jgi:hypothetical protein